MAADTNAARPVRRGIHPVATMLVGLLMLGLGGVAYYFGHGELWLVNGLDIPVVVELDGQRIELGPGAKTSLWTSVGVHRARTFNAAGALVEEEAFALTEEGSGGLSVYSVAGAAPVYVENIEYSSQSFKSPTDKEPTIDMLGGQRYSSKERVDYVFTEPPKSLTTDSRSTAYLVKTHADVAPGGWRTTVSYLAGKQRLDVAAAIVRDVARAEPDSAEAQATAMQLATYAGGRAAGLNAAAQWRAMAPRSEDAHRAYQNLTLLLGHADEIAKEYREWYTAGDKRPEAASLLARVLPPAEAQAVLDEALVRHPDAPVLLLRKGLLAARARRWAEADALFTKAAASPEYVYFASDHAEALVALGRPAEAAEKLSGALEQAGGRDRGAYDLELAVIYARIARLPGVNATPAAWTYVDKLASGQGMGWRGVWARSLFGESTSAPLDKAGTADVIAIHQAALESPASAWSACAHSAPVAYAQLESTVAILLGAEFARAGDMDLAERLLAPRDELLMPWRALTDYATTGAESPWLVRLRPAHRAALDLVRARALEAAGQPAEAMYAAAKEGDVLHGVVARAIESWPKLGAPAQRPAAHGAGSVDRGR